MAFRMEGPTRSIRWALWTMRSRMASAKGGFADDVVPLRQRQLAGDQDGGVVVSVLDDFHEIASLIGIEAVGAPIVEDQEIGSGEGPEQAGVAAVGTPHFQFGEHPWDALVENGEVVAAGLLAERAGEP